MDSDGRSTGCRIVRLDLFVEFRKQADDAKDGGGSSEACHEEHQGAEEPGQAEQGIVALVTAQAEPARLPRGLGRTAKLLMQVVDEFRSRCDWEEDRSEHLLEAIEVNGVF